MRCTHPRHHASFQETFLRGKQNIYSAVQTGWNYATCASASSILIVCVIVHIYRQCNALPIFYTVSVNSISKASLQKPWANRLINITMAHPPHHWLLNLAILCKVMILLSIPELYLCIWMNCTFRLLPIDPVTRLTMLVATYSARMALP